MLHLVKWIKKYAPTTFAVMYVYSPGLFTGSIHIYTL